MKLGQYMEFNYENTIVGQWSTNMVLYLYGCSSSMILVRFQNY